jgi:hypothetical protein
MSGCRCRRWIFRGLQLFDFIYGVWYLGIILTSFAEKSLASLKYFLGPTFWFYSPSLKSMDFLDNHNRYNRDDIYIVVSAIESNYSNYSNNVLNVLMLNYFL